MKKEWWVGKKIRRGGDKIVILSNSTSTQIPYHKTSKKNDISKKHSKQAIKQGKLRKNYKMFANPVFITPGRYIFLFFFACNPKQDLHG